MLLTITTTHRPASDRLQTFSVPFGQTHVFYPEADEERCTAALLLEIDPVGLASPISWHLERCDRLLAQDPEWFPRTDRRVVDVTDIESQAGAAAWWEQITAAGDEGMVVKPLTFIARGARVRAGCRGAGAVRAA